MLKETTAQKEIIKKDWQIKYMFLLHTWVIKLIQHTNSRRETCLNQTMNKTESCINQTLDKVLM